MATAPKHVAQMKTLVIILNSVMAHASIINAYPKEIIIIIIIIIIILLTANG